MSEDLEKAARAGILRGDLTPLAPFLRSFDNGTLALLAGMIEGSIDAYRVVVKPSQTSRGHRARTRSYEIGAFVQGLVDKGDPKENAVADASKKFRVARSKVFAACKEFQLVGAGLLQLVAELGQDEAMRLLRPLVVDGDDGPLIEALRRAAPRSG